jgi:hypothetical protein
MQEYGKNKTVCASQQIGIFLMRCKPADACSLS